MKCAVHPDVEAIGFCRNCGKALCSACARPIHGVLYCENCLAGAVGLPAPAPGYGSVPLPAMPPPVNYSSVPPTPLPPAAKSSGNGAIAFLLGLIPGMGAVYNGEYNKALIYIVIFVATVVGLSSDMSDGSKAFLGIFLGFFVLYMAIDAMRTANARRSGVAPWNSLENWSKGQPLGPALLIGLGVLLLLNNFEVFSFMGRMFFPLILIGGGIAMLKTRLDRRA